MVVTRTDSVSGWGTDLSFMCGARELHVGAHDCHDRKYCTTNVKTVETDPNMFKQCPSIVNKRNWLGDDDHDDTYRVTMQDECAPAPCRRRVRVQRADSNDGWGLDLKFKCGSQLIEFGTSENNMKLSGIYPALTEHQCPERIDRDNWENSEDYTDHFYVTTTGCLQ